MGISIEIKGYLSLPFALSGKGRGSDRSPSLPPSATPDCTNSKNFKSVNKVHLIFLNKNREVDRKMPDYFPILVSIVNFSLFLRPEMLRLVSVVTRSKSLIGKRIEILGATLAINL